MVAKTVMKTIITLVTTAFGLVAGLAWNDAIQKLIETLVGTGDWRIIHICYYCNYISCCCNHHSC